ncbi:hypothetical protein ACLKA6_003280 [Drosophila palustris]
MYENEQNEEGGSQPPQDSNQPQRSPSIQDSDEDSKSEEVLTLEKRIKDLEKSFEQTLQMNNKLQKTLEEHEYLQRSLQNRPTAFNIDFSNDVVNAATAATDIAMSASVAATDIAISVSVATTDIARSVSVATTNKSTCAAFNAATSANTL